MNDFRTKLHIEPPLGWLNDPNGLCQKDGIYYVYFQYSPEDVLGGKKVWGLYKGENLFDLKFDGEHILADTEFDKDGAYSGSAFVEDGKIHIFYTGNVKEDIENADFITSGRQSNTIYTSTEDGKNYSKKEILLTNENYPDNYTQHIRDPKVFKENDMYYMVLGGRTLENIGSILIYTSKNLKNWEFSKEITSTNKLGFMWECPDIFSLDAKHILSISPQGVNREKFTFQNVYGSGYFISEENFTMNNPKLENFKDWDYGFDFYAPQTFLDENGRRILIGWAGLPDIENEYTNASTSYGWQHLMTIPRVLECENNTVYQKIPREFFDKLGEKVENIEELSKHFYADVQCENSEGTIAKIANGLEISYENEVFEMKYTSEIGCGRTSRFCKIERLENVKIIMDNSIIEVFLNDGEKVFTSRIYVKDDFKVEIFSKKFELYNIK